MKVKVITKKKKSMFVESFILGNPNVELNSDFSKAKNFDETTAMYLQEEMLKHREVLDVEVIS